MTPKEEAIYQIARQNLVAHLRSFGIRDQSVLNAFGKVPRHLFIDKALRSEAYKDIPLPIGDGQTISQPYIVAQMTSVLCQGTRLRNVLEIGTGSGYQAAILSYVVDNVYSVERIQHLALTAKKRLVDLDLQSIQIKYGDGYQGWPEYGPYDGIIVTAAPDEVPEALLNQLAEGGRLVIPVGELDNQQLLMVIRSNNHFHKTLLELVRFVPLLPGIK